MDRGPPLTLLSRALRLRCPHCGGGPIWWTWPSPPWGLFQLVTIVLMAVAPFGFFPFSKTVFLAFDLWVRPPAESDFVVPHEVARRHRPA